VPKVLGRLGLKVDDIACGELNEARGAGAVLRRQLGIPMDRLNVNGGAIAVGHTLRRVGQRLTGHALIEAAPRRQARVRHDVHRRRHGAAGILKC
jgi:acetyl-CoA C-acetyltransferase